MEELSRKSWSGIIISSIHYKVFGTSCELSSCERMRVRERDRTVVVAVVSRSLLLSPIHEQTIRISVQLSTCVFTRMKMMKMGIIFLRG
jgi:hypothetical protein